MNYTVLEDAQKLQKMAGKFDKEKNVEVNFELHSSGMPDKTKQPQEYDAWKKDYREVKVMITFENVPMQQVLHHAAKPVIILLQNQIRDSFNELPDKNFFFIDAGNMKSPRTTTTKVVVKKPEEMSDEELDEQFKLFQEELKKRKK